MTFAEVAAIENARARRFWGDDESASRNNGVTSTIVNALRDGPKDADFLADLTGKKRTNVQTILARGVRAGRFTVDKTVKPYRYAVQK